MEWAWESVLGVFFDLVVPFLDTCPHIENLITKTGNLFSSGEKYSQHTITRLQWERRVKVEATAHVTRQQQQQHHHHHTHTHLVHRTDTNNFSFIVDISVFDLCVLLIFFVVFHRMNLFHSFTILSHVDCYIYLAYRLTCALSFWKKKQQQRYYLSAALLKMERPLFILEFGNLSAVDLPSFNAFWCFPPNTLPFTFFACVCVHFKKHIKWTFCLFVDISFNNSMRKRWKQLFNSVGKNNCIFLFSKLFFIR